MKLILILLVGSGLAGQTPEQLETHAARATAVEYRGRAALQLLAAPGADNGASYAVIRGSNFTNGTIEADLAGRPAAGAAEGARGFIGIAFRLREGRYEYIYLRPTNGRANDQVRRNHSTQYGSHPDYDFARLRREAPEKYESYVDLEPGVWTRYKIVVQGSTARLYVHGAAEPCLIVNDLKMGESSGAVALWVGPGTEGYFANLRISQ